IYILRGDIFSAPDDDVIDPPGQMQVTVFVQRSLVAGPKPSIHEAAGVGFGIVLVTAKHARALNGDFPALVGSQVTAFIVQNTNANARAHADRTRFAMPRRQRI